MTARLQLLVMVAAVLVAGCEAPPPESPVFVLELRAVRDNGEGLAGVTFSRKGAKMGATGGEGVLRVRLRGREGMRLPLSASCPDGFRGAGEGLEVVLRTLRTADGKRAPITAEAVCRPTERIAALVVKTAPNVPVVVQGREVARTDAGGIAHASLRLAPNSTFRVELNTDDQPDLRPRSPVTTLTVMDRDEIFPIAFEFKKEAAKKPKPRPRPKKPPGPKRPERVD